MFHSLTLMQCGQKLLHNYVPGTCKEITMHLGHLFPKATLINRGVTLMASYTSFPQSKRDRLGSVLEKPIDSNQTALAQNKDGTPPGQAGLSTRANQVAIRT